MLAQIEHIGIAVKDAASSEKLYTALLGKPSYKKETIASEQVNTVFFQAGNVKIELLEAQGEESAIAKFITKRGEGIHHIAFRVEDIYTEIQRLKSEGFEFVLEEPKQGADNMLICFLHPKSANGVLVELCQEIKK
jgi:methylmalonyl-CoA/ethylmalonyl-CoA epimerase